MNWLQLKALSFLAPVILGFATKKLVDLLEHFSTWLYNGDPRTKVLVAGVASLAMNGAAAFAASALPADCVGQSATFDACLAALRNPSALQVLLTWIFAHIVNSASNKSAAR